MEQYLDTNDGKFHITMFADIPRLIVKNKLNFRIYSTTNRSDGVTNRDPDIYNSTYVFPISQKLLGKKVFFDFSFDITKINDISSFKIGLCDENHKWIKATLFDVNNEYVFNESPEIVEDVVVDTANSERIATDVIDERTELPAVDDGTYILAPEELVTVESTLSNHYLSESELVAHNVLVTNVNIEKTKKRKNSVKSKITKY